MSDMRAQQRPDGLVELENACLSVRLDPRHGASAWSLLDRATGRDRALCEGYNHRFHPALAETLLDTSLREGRIEAPLPAMRLLDLGVDAATGAARAVFSGYPDAPGQARVRVVKTCRLLPDTARLQVTLEWFNEGRAPVPLAVWVSNGLRFSKEDADLFAPSQTGLVQSHLPAHPGMSSALAVAHAGGGWTAAVARRGQRPVICLAAADDPIESIWNWLGKFDGFTLGFGAFRRQLAAGQSRSFTYTLEFLERLPYLDDAGRGTAETETRRNGRLAAGSQSRQAERHTRPRPTGKSTWAAVVGDRPLPPRTQRCNRSVRHPMIPWMNPAAGRRLKVLFLGEASFNTAVYRDLARRGDFEWDFVNLWSTGDMFTGPYGSAETQRARRRLTRFQPDCVLTAGLRFASLDPALVEDLWRFAQGGGGLLIVGRDSPEHRGPWPNRLATDEVQPAPLDPEPGLQALFDAGIAPGPWGALQAFRAGRGRIVILETAMDWPTQALYGDAGPRNDLLPRYRGRTRLPDWEYPFARYLKLIRQAAGAATGVAIRQVTLTATQLTVDYASTAARRVTLAYELFAIDRLRVRRGRLIADLAAGTGALTVPLETLPVNEYGIHAWLLEGAVAGPAGENGDTEGGPRLEERQAGPVLDFAVQHAVLQADLAIVRIAVEGRRHPVPAAVMLEVEAPPDLRARAEAEVEWRHGAFDRIVWRQREPLAGRTILRFDAITFAPVSHEGVVAVRVRADGRVIAERAEPVEAWKAGTVADAEIAFMTAAGNEHDWYGTRMMRRWAEEEAGFDLTVLRYGLERGSFPWTRGANLQLDPPIVAEQPLRDLLARQLRQAFEEQGHAYLNLSDEFRLGGEYDWSEPTLAAFRDHLARRYERIEALNAQWGTAFPDFDAVRPIRLDEARRRPDNPSAWLDFRLFMDSRVNRRYEIAAEEATKISPLLRVGDSGAYTPGVDVGINVYTMIRASRFTLSYTGLRSEWVRSFLPDGALAGLWLGYGWADPVLVWDTLFRGFHVLAWWGYLLHKRLTARTAMSLIHLDLTPTPPFREIGRHQREIRRGLGRLLRHARPTPARVVLPYSQASVYAGAITGDAHEAGAQAALGLLQEQRLDFRFVADEAAETELPAAGPGILCLMANVDAIPAPAAAAYARAFAQGAFFVADAAAGMRDGHGKRMTRSPLDAAFGLDRTRATVQKPDRFEPIRWTREAPPDLRRAPGQMAPALQGLQAADGTVWARYENGEPAVMAARSAAGSTAILLNTRLPWLASRTFAPALNPEDRPDELTPSATASALFGYACRLAGLAPPLRVESDSVKPQRFARFDDGRIRAYGLVTGHAAGRLAVRFPDAAPTYDARRGRYFGCVDRIEDQVKTADLAKLYVQLPYAVTGLEIRMAPRAAAPGDTITLDGRVVAADGAEADQFHVIHAALTDPLGRCPPWQRANLPAMQGRFQWRIPLALNAPAGRWRLTLRDAATGIRRTASIRVG